MTEWIERFGFQLALILLISFGVAVLFYRTEKKNNTLSKVLILLRTLLFSGLMMLIIWPVFQDISSEKQKKTRLFLVDNSASVKQAGFQFDEFQKEVQTAFEAQNQELNIEFLFFDEPKLKLNYNGEAQESNISGALKALTEFYEASEIQDVVLVSDGIFNQSYHPKWLSKWPNFNVHTLAVGDSIQYPDVSFGKLRHNAFSYLGNDFPVEVLIETKAWENQTIELVLKDKKAKILKSKTFTNPKQGEQLSFETELEAKSIGIQDYTLELLTDVEEKNTENNRKTFQIEVLESRTKVLLLHSEIHPDFAAFAQALKEDQSTELVSKSIREVSQNELKSYNAVLFLGYQNQTQAFLKQSLEAEQAFVLVLHQTSDLEHLVLNFSYVFQKQSAQQLDWEEAKALPSPVFSSFTLDEKTKRFLNEVPPLNVPFFDLKIKTKQQLFLQQLGQSNGKSVLSFGEHKSSRFALLQAEGFWKWRMFNYREHKRFDEFDGLFKSVLRFVNLPKNKQTCYVDFPKILNQNQNYEMQVKLYNDAYEQISGDALDLQIELETGENKQTFALVNTSGTYFSELRFDELGTYTFKITNLSKNGKIEQEGSFQVKENTIENKAIVAQFDVLRTISQKTDAQFFTFDERSELLTKLAQKPIDFQTFETQETKSLFDYPWILVSLLVLMLLEWFLRRKNQML